MKKLLKFLKRNTLYIAAIVIALALTPLAVLAARIDRGYWAVGGEWLPVLLAVLVVAAVRGGIFMFRECRRVLADEDIFDEDK